MKKELLVASALATTLLGASVAQAATASFSGHSRNGVEGEDTDGTADGTFKASQQSSLSFSVSETTDSGIKVSTGFTVADEGAADGANTDGLTLTFTDGSKLDLVEAGNAYASQLASVPGASGEQGVAGTSTNNAPTGLTFANASSSVGFEWHSAADAMGVEGLKIGLSGSTGDDGDGNGSSSTVETAYSVGLSYVTTAGDSTVTVGGGFVSADDSNADTSNSKGEQFAISATAATGDLTVGVGFASGTEVQSKTTTTQNVEVDGAEIMTAGAKYVSGDMTFAVGYVDGEAKDTTSFGSAGSKTDTYESTAASVTYSVASGVSAILGYSDQDRGDESSATANNSGSAWYVGALVSF